MPITLYMEYLSPPSRATMMVAEAIGLDLDYEIISLANGDNLKPNFLKINPQHTLPTLVDESTVIWDSHAIITYIVSKYGKDDSLYPKDLKKRAIVDQRLHFDTGSLLIYLRLFIKKCLSKRGRLLEEYERNFILESYNLMEEFLNHASYMAGDFLSVADLSIITSVTGLNIMVPISAEQYPRLSEWIEKMKLLPFYNKVNDVGVEDLKTILHAIADSTSFH